MKYFLDTEFIEDGKTIDLASIGLVREDGETLYLQNLDCQFSKANDWVWRHVFPHLEHFDMSGRRSCYQASRVNGSMDMKESWCHTKGCPWRKHYEIGKEVTKWITRDDGPLEFWGYYADYDWVAFCQLFGQMSQLPGRFPMYCNDIKQLISDKRVVSLPGLERKKEHHALDDALWNKAVYEFLMSPK